MMKGKVVPDEYDERTFCAYDSDASTAYGLSAFGLLLLSQAVVSAATRCLCFGRGLSAGGPRTCAIASFVVSWWVIPPPSLYSIKFYLFVAVALEIKFFTSDSRIILLAKVIEVEEEEGAL